MCLELQWCVFAAHGSLSEIWSNFLELLTFLSTQLNQLSKPPLCLKQLLPSGHLPGPAPLRLSRPLTQDECENRFYLWNIMVYLKNTVAKWIGFLALIWCYYSNNLGQSVSQSRILIVTSDTQTSRASSSTKCRHYASLLTNLKVWWNIFFMFNRGLDHRS